MKRYSFLVVMLLAAACVRRVPPPNSGIQATITIGPMCPVVRIEQPCPDHPYQAEVIVRDASGAEVARGEANADGVIRLGVFPGDYQVEARSPQGTAYPRAASVPAHVIAGQWTDVAIIMDSGIR